MSNIFRFAHRLLAALAFGVSAARAELRDSDVHVVIHASPDNADVAAKVRVSPMQDGRQTLEVTLTNVSGREAALRDMRVEFPWVKPDGAGFLLSTGGWDMGRTEAQVREPGHGKLETASYMMAHHAGSRGYSLAGFVTWKAFFSKINYLDGAVTITADGEGRRLAAGESIALEKIWFADNADWQDLMFAYADEIARENKIKLNAPKHYAGWATWDYFGRNWTAQNVEANLEALLKIYPQADFLQIDGGWWPQRGDYTSVKPELQPDGMKRLGQLIRAKGLIAGIHLDGMRGDAKAKVAIEHPDFFLKDQNGKMLVESSVNVGEQLDYTFFDYSNPKARDYIRDAVRLIRREWGYDYFKVDFLRFGLNEFIAPVVSRGGEKHEIVPSNRSLTSLERFHLGLAAMREGMGKDAYFVGCSAVFGPTYGHVDGLRTGADINPGFRQYKRTAVDNAGNFFLHGKVVYTDADYHVVRAKEDQDAQLVKAPSKNGGALAFNEAEMWTHYVGLFGGIKLNSDNLPTLREERRELFRVAASLPTSERFVPIDFWQHARNDEDPAAVMLGESHGRVHLAVFNWTDAAQEFRLRGWTAEELRGVTKIGGDAMVQQSDGTLTVNLPAHHSTIFQVEGANFDRLRKAMVVEGPPPLKITENTDALLGSTDFEFAGPTLAKRQKPKRNARRNSPDAPADDCVCEPVIRKRRRGHGAPATFSSMKNKYTRALGAILLGWFFLAPALRAAEMSGEPHVYKKVGDRELHIYVFKPKDWQASDKRPAIVFIHGGGWTGGAPNAFARQAEYLATRGMVTMSVQYRLLEQGKPAAPFICMQDAKSAMRWVRAHTAELGIDPNRIAAGGGSAGGHLSAVLAMVPGYDDPADDLKISVKPAALVLFNPFVGYKTGDTNTDDRIISHFGPEGKEFARSTPANYVTKDAPPTIIFHGENDVTVPPAQVKAFAEDMKKAGVRCELVMFPGEVHSFFNRGKAFYETLIGTDKFLASLGWLQGPPTLKVPENADAETPAPKGKKKKAAK